MSDTNIIIGSEIVDVVVTDDIIDVTSAGEQGPPGPGVPAAGTTGQVLAKNSNTDYDTEWVDAAAGGGGATNLGYTAAAGNGVVTSDTGTDATVPAADGANAGLMLPAAFTKLAGIEAGATADQTAAEILAALLTVDGAGSGLDADTIDALSSAALLARANHTGDQAAATISDFDTQVRTSRLDQMAAPTADVALNARKITGLAEPTLAQDAATRAYVLAVRDALVASAPGLLDTLDEIAAALGDDPNFATTITTALAGKQPLDTDLTAIAALVSAADKLLYATGAGTWGLADLTSYARTFLDDADAAAARTTLGLGTAATAATGDFQPVDADLTAIAALTTTAYGRSVLEAANAAALRTLAGVVIGTNVQAWDADLDTLAANNAGTTTWLAALLNGTYVALTGDQTVAGIKTFSSAPLVPDNSWAIADTSGLQTALDAKAALAGATFTGDVVLPNPLVRQTVNAQTGTTYTPVLSDEGKLVTLSNASAITLTLPQDSAVAIPVGGRIDFAQIGAGQVTFAAGTGATVNSTPGLKCRAQYSSVSAIKRAANTWLLVGDLAA